MNSDKVLWIPIGKLTGTRQARVLTYPRLDVKLEKLRIGELAGLGVEKLGFSGRILIDGVPVLGKGCVGVVANAIVGDELAALKIRRVDADRPSMQTEARLLRLANAVGVGPQLLSFSQNFLAMKLFQGLPLFRWAETSKSRARVRDVLAELLQTCFKLDAIGLDHGELSHAPRNVLVSQVDEPCVVDFESASTTRRVANVTSLLQYFLFGDIARRLQTPKLFTKRREVVKSLGEYKREISVENFQTILGILRL